MKMRAELFTTRPGKKLPLAFVLLASLFGPSINAEQADPTRPAWVAPLAGTATPSATTPAPSPAVAGILYSKQRQVVMLNNRFYRVGDRVGQHLIIRIEPDSVDLKHAEQLLTLKLPRVVSIQQHH